LAAGMWDRMLNFLGFEEVEEEEPAEVVPAAPSPSRDELARRRGRRKPVVPLEPAARRTWDPHRERQELIVLVPRSFETAQEAADHLKAGRPVLLNLETTDRELAQKLIHFLSGSVYALNGEMHRVATGVMAFVPQGVDISLPPGARLGIGTGE
jgi:cell division inhibitor SepF